MLLFDIEEHRHKYIYFKSDEELLDGIELYVIENYVRKKKLEQLNKIDNDEN